MDGDGDGGTEVSVSGVKGKACIDACLEKKKTDASINGVTMWKADQDGCWCERNMNTIDTSKSTYRACFLTGMLYLLHTHCVLSLLDFQQYTAPFG